MKLAHLADLHLGFRRYERHGQDHLNVRERDVYEAFRSAVDGILAAKPDVVVVCGDVFHVALPRPVPIVIACQQIKRLRDAGLPVVVIAGNHDTPNSKEAGSILPLLSDTLEVDVATDETREFTYPDLDLCVTAVPDRVLRRGERDALQSHGSARYRVLVLHGEVEGVYRRGREGTRPAGLLSTADVASEEWSYIAIGDYHVQHQVGPRAWYSGSLEYVSPNIWGEIKDEGTPGKGWLLVDLDTGTVERQPVPLARMLYDLGPVDANGRTSEEVVALIADQVDAVDITNAIVRLRILDIPRAVSRNLDHQRIRAWKCQALDFHLDPKVPERIEVGCTVQPRKSQSLTEGGVDFLTNRFEPSPGIDRSALVTLFRQLMAEAEEVEMERMTKKAGAA